MKPPHRLAEPIPAQRLAVFCTPDYYYDNKFKAYVYNVASWYSETEEGMLKLKSKQLAQFQS